MRKRSIAGRALGVVALVLGVAATGAEAKPRFGLGVGVLVPTLVMVDDAQPEASPGPLLVMSFDAEIATEADAGLFLHVASFGAETRAEQVNLFDVGLAAHWIALRDARTTLRLGGGLGYRRLFADAARYDATQGIAVDLDATLGHRVVARLVLEVRVGATAQPWGRNAQATVILAPMPYFTVGAVF